MAEGRAYFQIKPSLIFWPGLLLSIAILSVNLIGDAARDALDPAHETAGGRQVTASTRLKPSFRGDAKHQTRHLGIRRLALTHHRPGMTDVQSRRCLLAMTARKTYMTNNVVLDINDLVVGLGKKPGGARIIDGVSLQVHEGETLCVVGESGSGKSVTSLTVMGLLQKGCAGAVRRQRQAGRRGTARPPATGACGSCAPPPWR